MSGLNQLRVGPRLMLGFGVMILFLLGAMVISLSRMATIQHHLERIVDENYAKIALLNTMRDTVRFRGTALRDVVLQPEFGFIRNESKRINQARKDYQAASEALQSRVMSSEQKSLLAAIVEAEAKASEGVSQVMDAALSEDTTTAQDLIRDQVRDQQRILIGAIEAMRQALEAESRALADEAGQAYRWAWGLTLAVGGLSILVGSLLAWAITRGLTGRLNEAVSVARRIAQGDLTCQVEVNGSDELAELQRALAEMNRSLSALIGQAAHAAHQVSGSAASLSDTTQAVADLADNQASQVTQAGGAIHDIGASIVHVAEDAASVATSANQARDVALEGHRNMQQSVGATERIVESVGRSSAAIDDLRAQIGEISQVTQVIREIADQTNLLALNAAIEAARAGEQGRGFAVVADEVRKLAERTSASTGSITETVNSVSAKTTQVVAAMAQVSADVNENAEISRVTRQLLDKIVTAASEVDRLIQQIAAETRAQTEASQGTSAAMARIAEISESNSVKMHDIKDAALGLSETARTLQGLVDRFKLG
ncbi:MAG: methyl-accepting chemotaxis protein [Pseudomonadota bacterium]